MDRQKNTLPFLTTNTLNSRLVRDETILEINLKDAGRYVAISHVWGNNFSECSLFGKSVHIGPRSKIDYIKKLALNNSLWIDNICIDQNDPEDIAAQIMHMDFVYGTAYEVYIIVSFSEYNMLKSFIDYTNNIVLKDITEEDIIDCSTKWKNRLTHIKDEDECVRLSTINCINVSHKKRLWTLIEVKCAKMVSVHDYEFGGIISEYEILKAAWVYTRVLIGIGWNNLLSIKDHMASVQDFLPAVTVALLDNVCSPANRWMEEMFIKSHRSYYGTYKDNITELMTIDAWRTSNLNSLVYGSRKCTKKEDYVDAVASLLAVNISDLKHMAVACRAYPSLDKISEYGVAFYRKLLDQKILHLPFGQTCMNKNIPQWAPHFGCACASSKTLFDPVWAGQDVHNPAVSFVSKCINVEGEEVFEYKVIDMGPYIHGHKIGTLGLIDINTFARHAIFDLLDSSENNYCKSCYMMRSIIEPSRFNVGSHAWNLLDCPKKRISCCTLPDVVARIKCTRCNVLRTCVIDGGVAKGDTVCALLVNSSTVITVIKVDMAMVYLSKYVVEGFTATNNRTHTLA